MHLTATHWIYLAGVVVIIAAMLLRKSILVPAVLATFLTAFSFTNSAVGGVTSIFTASLVAAQNLFSIFLVIALVTAMLHALQSIGADRKMVAPFRKIMRNGHFAFWTLVVVTYFISLFFWPTPAVPLIGAMLIPVAVRAGMRPMAIGMTIAISGQGMALSADYVIRVAPGLSAKAAGVSAGVVADKAMILSFVVGGVALLVTYAMEFRKMRKPSAALLTEWESSAQRKPANAGTETVTESEEEEEETETTTVAARGGTPQRELVRTGVGSGGSADIGNAAGPSGLPSEGSGSTSENDSADAFTGDSGDGEQAVALYPRSSTFFALFVPLAYLALIVYMFLASALPAIPSLAGGDAAALVGGVAVLVVFLITCVCNGKTFMESSATHVVDGLVFAFKAMGIVIPIAGFFFLGSSSFAGEILGTPEDQAPSLLFDLVTTAQQYLPESAFTSTFGILIIGMITGLEGSGFSGLPMTGSLAGALGGGGAAMSASSLAAIGQMGSIWAGGGTLVAWSSLIAVAGFARVSAIDLARKCFLPVCCGLVAAALVTVLLLG